MRGCLTLVIGFIAGVGVMLVVWPRPAPGVTAPPPSPDLTITMSAGYLAGVIQQQAAGQSLLSVQNVTVASSPPTDLIVHADVAAAGLSTAVAVDARPVLVNGGLQVQIVSIDAGGVPLPPAIGPLLTGPIDRSLHTTLGGRRVTSVRVTPSGLTITAQG